ncbi:MAG: hypothetical protein P4L51_17645 [Puia sp.]|nr:hypothetical protein [Puia sp.]
MEKFPSRNLVSRQLRKELKDREEERDAFTGVFKKYGRKAGFKGPSTETLLLVAIRNREGLLIADHCWFNLTKGFEKLGNLREGALIHFEARVKKYKKGYVNSRAGIDQTNFDYKLSHPTKISLSIK